MVKKVAKGVGMVIAACVCALLGWVVYWMVRPNTARVDPSLTVESWVAVGDGMHNSNTDLIYWRDHFYLIHASSPWHFGHERCELVLHRSADARQWAKLATFSVPDQDIRDPKLAIIGDRLFLYVLKNIDWNPEPYTTAFSTSIDGVTWSRLKDIEPGGWLFWRPKTRDGKTWYVPAYWWQHGRSALLASADGRTWRRVSMIYEGDRNDETDFEFLPDGRIICTARLEVSDNIFGDDDASTLIAVSDPPYTRWTSIKSRVTRLDGPDVFSHGGVIYAAGRHHAGGPGLLNALGSILGRKRTALYEVRPDRLIYLSDLPSCGDTSYAGVVIRNDSVYVSYYTNDIQRDYPWILGMVLPSDIRIARIPLCGLDRCRVAAGKADQ
jgi:hypothetical protein